MREVILVRISHPIVLGAVAGGIGTAVKEGVARILVNKGIVPFDGIQKSAGMVIPPYEIRTPKGTVVGVLMDLAIGGMLGTALAALHTKRIMKVNPFVGAMVGLGSWSAMYGGMGRLSAVGKTTPNGALGSAGWHLLYGVIVGSLIPLLAGQDPDKHSRRSVVVAGVRQKGPNGLRVAAKK